MTVNQETLADERWEAHRREHALAAQAVAIADTAAQAAIAAALQSVGKADDAQRAALHTALEDHHREHLVHEAAHGREHQFTDQALNKAEIANDKRFDSVNEFRSQLKDQASTLASRDGLDAVKGEIERRFNEINKTHAERFDNMVKSVGDRFDAQGRAITAIEKGDVKQEGKGIGQGAAIAAIVGAVGFSATLLGLLIVVANLLTKG